VAMLPDQVGLLERAIGYALGSVTAVAPRLLSRPTPCSDWDLQTLLHHVNDSLAALCEGIDSGRIGPDHASDDGHGLAVDPAATLRDRARWLLGAWTNAGRNHQVIAIVDRPLPASVVAGTGAIELAVHGWDISWACGQHRPIPPILAGDLLTICPLLVTEFTRHPQFAAPVAVSPLASASDRLVAFLGRRPDR
jgi:uncharacterized protein (TIGR03086 family)